MFNWLVLLSFYLPFQIALNPGIFLSWLGLNFASDFDFASTRLVIVLLFLVWMARFFAPKKRLKGKVGFIGAGLLVFLALSFFSLFGAEDIGLGIRKLLYFASVFPLYFLVADLASDSKKSSKIIFGLVSGAVLLSFVGVLQFIAQFVFGLENVCRFWAVNVLPVFSGFNLGALILAYPSWLVNVGGQTILRAFSFFSDPHAFSFYLGLILPLTTIFLFRAAKNSWRFVALLLIYLIMFSGLLLSFARGAYLAIFASFLVVSFLAWKYFGSRKIPVLLLASLLVFVVPATPFSSRFYSTFDLSEGSNLGRLEMWENASRLGLENFWQGVGLGGYFLSVNPALDYRNPVTAHNFYLDLFSEMGILAFLLWLVLLGGTILFLLGRLKEFWPEQKEKYLLVALIGSLVYFSVHSFFETVIYHPSVLAALMILLGLAANFLRKKEHV